MPTRPEALDTALIYLEILRRIPKNHKTTAQDIHRQLADIGIERDERSIQRYLEKLADRFCDDIDIDASSKPYGYKWKHGSKGLAIPTLGSEESLLLKLAAEHLRYLLPANIMATLAPFFAQADYRLAHGDKHKRGHEWLGKVCTVPTANPSSPPPSTAPSSAKSARRSLTTAGSTSTTKTRTANAKPTASCH